MLRALILVMSFLAAVPASHANGVIPRVHKHQRILNKVLANLGQNLSVKTSKGDFDGQLSPHSHAEMRLDSAWGGHRLVPYKDILSITVR